MRFDRALVGSLAFGVALAMLLGGGLPVAAQGQGRPATLDRLGRSDEPIAFTADDVEYDEELGLVTARGNVEIAQGDRVLKARTVSYNQKTRVVTASGNVVLLEPTGEVVFANYVELTDDLRDGFIEQVGLRLTNNARFAAAQATRSGGERTEMRRGVYSLCDLCKSDPTKAPLWQVKADRIVHDEVAKDITYHDAKLELFGVPVFYTPYFSHPDPTVKRRSGFLAPTFGSDSDLGFMLQTPYYWAIAPNQDATIAPIFLTKEGVVASGEYRHLFSNGEIRVEGSGGVLDRTERVRDGEDFVRENELRGHIRARGGFDLDENWRTRFQLYRASDDTYLRKLDLDNAYTLRSEAVAEYFDGQTYGTVSAFAVQELREDVDNDATPVVLPSAEFNWVGPTGRFGDYWTMDASAVALHRDGDNPQSRRTSVVAGWHLPWQTPSGHLFHASMTVRGDAYSVADVVDPSDPTGSNRLDGFAGRFYPQAEIGWRYPLVRATETSTQLIEPIVSAVLAPTGLNPKRIPNEDSRDVEFDETSLFDSNRFPGYDRVEGGQRLNYGVRTAVYWHEGGLAEFFLGQSLRAQEQRAFSANSGLEDEVSDLVGRVLVSPSEYLDLLYRFRLDKDDFSLRRSEAGFRAGPSWLRVQGEYSLVDTSEEADEFFEKREQLNVSVSTQLTPHWSLFAGHRRDLEENDPLENRLGFMYDDECFTLLVSYSRDYTSDRENSSGDRVLFRVILKSIGEIKATQGLGSNNRDG